MFIFYVLVITICLGKSSETESQVPSDERHNFFDAELFQVLNEKKEANLLVSPISIKLILGMLMEGSEGETAKEIRSALRLSNDKEAARKEFDSWLQVFQGKEHSSLKLADRIFISDKYSINPVYTKALSKHYAAGVTPLKFENVKESCKVINNWVNNQTNHMIPALVEEKQMVPDTKMMIASAVYFKGIWSTPFAKERTVMRCFYPKDKCIDTAMMMVTGTFDYGYISRLDATAVVLPFEGGVFSMLLLLPKKKDGMQELSRDLAHVSIKSIMSELTREEVSVLIPKFEIKHNEDLVGMLKRIRVSQMFGDKADFSTILKPDSGSLSVGRLLHSAKLTVDEEGSEAAAAIGALFVPLMGGTTTSFYANRPFLFFIVESVRNSILFAGKFYSPTGTSPTKNGLTKPETPSPKFRSINVIPVNSSRVPQASYSKILKSNQGPLLEQFISSSNKFRNRAKNASQSKNRKRQDDEWRRHVLLFS